MVLDSKTPNICEWWRVGPSPKREDGYKAGASSSTLSRGTPAKATAMDVSVPDGLDIPEAPSRKAKNRERSASGTESAIECVYGGKKNELKKLLERLPNELKRAKR